MGVFLLARSEVLYSKNPAVPNNPAIARNETGLTPFKTDGAHPCCSIHCGARSSDIGHPTTASIARRAWRTSDSCIP